MASPGLTPIRIETRRYGQPSDQANSSGKAGVNSTVVVQGEDDFLFRTEWSSAPDAHPLPR